MPNDASGRDKPQAVFTGYGHLVTPADRAAWQVWSEERAQTAFKNGTQAALMGHRAEALHWLQRASRMATDDINVEAALAFAYFADENWTQARACFCAILAKMRVPQIMSALAATYLKLGHYDAASTLIDALLRETAPLTEIISLARSLSREKGLLGWAGVTNAGVLVGEAVSCVDVALDDVQIASNVELPFILPQGWAFAKRLQVTISAANLMGSPIDLGEIRRSEGFVSCDKARLKGWVWYPHDPETSAEIRITIGAETRAVTPIALDSDVNRFSILRKARRFELPIHDLDKNVTIHVTDRYGVHLYGSPITAPARRLLQQSPAKSGIRPPYGVARAELTKQRDVAGERQPGCLVIIPVYLGFEDLRTCLDSINAGLQPDVEILVVNDASPDHRIAVYLDQLAATARITLFTNAENLGFVASVNLGLARAKGRDVILLNSDARFFRDGMTRLRQALDTAPEVGTATPLSNNATIFSFPNPDATRNEYPTPDEGAFFDATLAAGRMAEGVPVPTGHGFCLAIRGDCLSDIGLLREDVFAQGYGEENDFCLRAARHGWRHIAATRVYVAHRGSVSFHGARDDLLARNMRLLEALHPGYHVKISAFMAADALAPLRNDAIARAMTERREACAQHSVIIVTHDAGGGVERVVQQRIMALRAQGLAAIIVRPHEVGCKLQMAAEPIGEVVCRLPNDWATFVKYLHGLSPVLLEVHHMVGHAPIMHDLREALDVSFDVFVHDYACFCPRVTLLSFNDVYCGEPVLAGCVKCINQLGSLTGEEISVPALVARSAATLKAARRVVTPCQDVSTRMARHFEKIPLVVVPPEETCPRTRSSMIKSSDEVVRVCIVGAIGREKGFGVVLKLARHIATHNLAMEILIVGHTVDDDALIETGKVRITGEYADDDDALNLIDAFAPRWGFIPSIWPETWCFTLSLLMNRGIETVVFDLGAQSERVLRQCRGVVVPVNMDIVALVDVFMQQRPQKIGADV